MRILFASVLQILIWCDLEGKINHKPVLTQAAMSAQLLSTGEVLRPADQQQQDPCGLLRYSNRLRIEMSCAKL